MATIRDAATEFLANRRVAVTGVSRQPKGHGSNVVYQRLRQRVTRSSPSIRTQMRSKAIPAIATYARSPAASTRS